MTFRRIRAASRKMFQALGWDLVRYRPAAPGSSPHWKSFLAVDRLSIGTIIDIGAKDGDTARVFRSRFPEATIHCFEPHPVSYAALAEWAATRSPPVHCHPFALGNATGEARLNTSGARLAVASLLPPGAWRQADPSYMAALVQVPVALRRLDDIPAMAALDGDVLIKIDTEGFEREVILGGMTVFRGAAACIVEVHLLACNQGAPVFREIVELMGTVDMAYAGNLYQAQRPKGEVTYVDCLFVKSDLLSLERRIEDATR